MQYSDLPIKGLVVTNIDAHPDRIIFTCDLDRRKFEMSHTQDCCESVSIEDVVGDLEDLLYSPMLEAGEAHQDADNEKEDYVDSATWTFYKFGTIKGSVTIRWYGSSNGYYSETASFEEIDYG
jgi:predicted acetyltransferase